MVGLLLAEEGRVPIRWCTHVVFGQGDVDDQLPEPRLLDCIATTRTVSDNSQRQRSNLGLARKP